MIGKYVHNNTGGKKKRLEKNKNTQKQSVSCQVRVELAVVPVGVSQMVVMATQHTSTTS